MCERSRIHAFNFLDPLWWRTGGVGHTSFKMEQSTCGMGHELMEFTSMHQRTPPQIKFFSIEDPHIKSLYIVQYCINTVYFSPLQVIIDHVKEL
jgi:hypothetical protein